MSTHGLRYSPVNDLIVTWNMHGQPFNNCGLPKPRPAPEHRPSREVDCCGTLAILIEPDTYDWARWLPEVIVGIEDPDEEIAASYVREAAIEFAARARVLTRKLEIKLECGVTIYPVPCFDNERLGGLHHLEVFAGDQRIPENFIKKGFDARLGTVFIEVQEGSKAELVLYAVPTEDSCAQDVYLYDAFRRAIAQEARSRYVRAVHFRDIALVRSLNSPQEFDRSIALARSKVMAVPVQGTASASRGLFR